MGDEDEDGVMFAVRRGEGDVWSEERRGEERKMKLLQ